MKAKRSRRTLGPNSPYLNLELNGVLEMKTKIGTLRAELLRIGCVPTLDPWNPQLSCNWSYTKIVVRGKHVETFDYDMLCAVLNGIPSGAGEDFFWNRVRATDFNLLADKLNQEMIAALKRDCVKVQPT
jgi:hypothetical protein